MRISIKQGSQESEKSDALSFRSSLLPEYLKMANRCRVNATGSSEPDLVSRAHFAWLSNASSSAPDPRSTVYREGVHMLKALAIRLAVLSLGEAYACMFVIRPDRCIRSSVIIILFLLRWHCVVQRQYSVPLYQSRLRGQLGEVLVHSHHQDIAIVK